MNAWVVSSAFMPVAFLEMKPLSSHSLMVSVALVSVLEFQSTLPLYRCQLSMNVESAFLETSCHHSHITPYSWASAAIGVTPASTNFWQASMNSS